MIKNESLCKQIKVEFINIPDEECEILREWFNIAVKLAQNEITGERVEREEN